MENMDGSTGHQAEFLKRFRMALNMEYAAFAKVDERDNQIRYECVTGNNTNRHIQMVKRPGNGIAGLVVRHGRPVIIDGTHPDLAKAKMQYPIMLAEKLEAVLAVPIYRKDTVAGALLGAVRHARVFAPDEVERAVQMADEWASILCASAVPLESCGRPSR